MRRNDPKQREAQRKEVENYIDECLLDEAAQGMKDVFVTDHVAKSRKFNTRNEEEDA